MKHTTISGLLLMSLFLKANEVVDESVGVKDLQKRVEESENKSSLYAARRAQTKVNFTTITPDAEKMMAFIARVSNPAHQEKESDNYAGLLRYCVKNHHWSVFEQASMTLEVETSRAICTQMLRHRSFTFQQFSQRYADNSLIADEIQLPQLRRQDYKNRQNSIDNLTDEEQAAWDEKMSAHFEQSMQLYKDMLADGIAKECARFVLPEVMQAKIYMTGSIRSWIHYIELRTANGTQKEHMEVALKCKEEFIKQLPTVAKALGWTE